MTQPYKLSDKTGYTTRYDYITMVAEKRTSMIYSLNLGGLPGLEMRINYNFGRYEVFVYVPLDENRDKFVPPRFDNDSYRQNFRSVIRTPFFCTEVIDWVEFKKNVVENYNLWVVHQVINE